MADNLKVLIDELREARNEIKEINHRFEAELGPVKEREARIEEKIIAALEKQGLRAANNSGLTAAIQVQTLPKIDDFDKFANYVYRNRALHLLERRVGRNAYRELIEERKGKPISGLSHIEKKTVTLRATGES